MRPLALVVLLTAVLSHATALEVGEKAPSLAKIAWMKGAPVQIGSGITVVEFWATWCGPCKVSIPHLTELQKKYQDKVTIVGLSDEDAPTAKPFIDAMGAKMDYHVGLVDPVIHQAYMEGVEGIPYAFVVDASGTVVWSGFIEGLDKVVAQVVAGTFDAKKGALVSKAEGELMRLLRSPQPDVGQVMKMTDALLTIDPLNMQGLSVRLSVAKFLDKPDMVRETLLNLPLKDAPAALANSLAYSRATDESLVYRHLDVAMMLVDHALTLEPANPGFLDTKARLLASIGLIDQAIALQQQAATATPDDAERAATLAYYQAAKKLATTIGSGNKVTVTPATPAPAAVP